MDSVGFDPLDTRSCESEPIRYPGSVQPHGALLVVDPLSATIEAASESCREILGLHAHELLGQSLASVVGPAVAGALPEGGDATGQPLLSLAINGQSFTARRLCNATGQHLIDIEPAQSGNAAPGQFLCDIRAGLEALRRLDSSADVCTAAAQLFRKLTGLDQVMVYRFDAQWNGEVIAEAAGPAIESYLGLRFPASDIPKQARALFEECRVRLIADVHYLPSALVGRGNAPAIDLGLSNLRSVSPLHIQYLKNMGARATLVCALVVKGQLWGLVSCQQKQAPWYCSPAERQALGWLCQDVSALLEARIQSEHSQREQRLGARRRTLINAVRSLEFSALMRAHNNADLLGVVDADGFALVLNDAMQTTGFTPSPERIRALNQSRLARHPDANPYASQALAHDLGVGPGDDGVAGALFVTVLRQPVVTMVWFRRERVHKLVWGGDPTQPHLADARGQLTPRTSFAQYQQSITGQSEAWRPEELQSASELVAVVEIEALRSSEAFSTTILNSMTEHIFVLDERGVIVSVNDAWKQFAVAHDAPGLSQSSLGMNYREICSAAVGQPWGDDAAAAWTGIDAILKRLAAHFCMDYLCEFNDQKCWLRMNVYPLHASSGGAIVVCQDVTPSKRAELARERSEAHLNVAQKIASLGSWEWEVNADTMRWSDEQYRIFGYAPGSCRPTYAMFVQAVHPDDRNTFTLAIDTALAVKLPYNIECRIVRPDGSVRNTQCQGAVETGAGGQALRMAGTVIDITERTASAAELAQTHQKLLANQFAMERAGIGIAWTDFVTGRFIYVNKYFAELLGHPMDEMLSRSVSDIAPEFDLGAYEQLGVTLLKFGKATFETILVARDGRCMAVEVSVHYREGYGDLSPHHIAFITDISGRKETEQALIKAQVAEAATVAKSAFLANMSHEIRTPMNAIIGMTQLFRRGQLTQQQLSQLDQIDVSTEHLLDVINDILDLSKIEAGKFMLEDGGLVISALMERVSTIVLPHIHAKGLQLIVETEPLAVPLRGDMTRLSQALINFANNAVKFTNQGTVTIRARLVEETQDTQLMRFEVSDTGIGIAPEPLGRLFTAFEQGDSSTTRAYGGTGLGLAIAKRLAELMGGEAGAVSTVGAGSLFWFTARLTKSEVLQESPAAPMTPDEDAEAILLRDFTGKRLLIAEDDPVNQMVACMILEDTGLVIDIAEDGAQAVEKARQVAYDLIFMDLQMPKMDGVAATQSIRALPGYGEVPIIAFTANAFLEDRNRCLDAGMNDFVAKPMYPAMLCGMVLKWLRLRESNGLPA